MATVRKRALPSGVTRWQASYIDKTGRRRAKMFARRADADTWLVKVRRDLQLGTHVPEQDSITVAAACADYLDYCQGRLDRGERMTRKYLNLCTGHINNHLLNDVRGIGATRLAKLTRVQIGDFRDRLRNGGMTVLTTRKVLGTLSRVLDHSISKDRLAINLARGVVVIGTRDEGTKRVGVPSKEAVRAILSAADPDLRMVILFAASTGVRAGELWALRWKHTDLTSREVTVERRVDAYGDEDVTKSSAGMRTIPLSDTLLSELKAWKLRSAFSKPDDLVFPNTTGAHVNHSNFLNREWPTLFVAMGPVAPAKFKWHHLRHFAASCWIEAGLQPKTVQTFIGHATLALTMDTYGHLFKSDDHRRAMDQIAGTIFA